MSLPGPGGAAPADVLARLQAVLDAALVHLSLEDLLDELLTRVRDALDADTCAVLLIDDDGVELVARAAKGIEEEVEQGVRIPVGQGFAGRIAGSGWTSTAVTGAPASRSARSARSEFPHITNCGVPFMKSATGSFSITL